jgi:hypothetical protein
MTAAPATLEHRLPQRFRLRVPSRRGDADYFAALVACLAEYPEVEEARADPRTAGILVLHRGEEAAILDLACTRKLISLTDPHPDPVPAPEASQSAAPRDPGAMNDLLAAALLVLGGVQVLRGRTLGPASELLWNTYALASVLRGSPLMPVAAVAILIQIVRGPLLGSASSLLFYALASREIARRARIDAEEPVPRDDLTE